MKIKVIAKNIRQVVFYLRKEAHVKGEIMLMQIGKTSNENGDPLNIYGVYISSKNSKLEGGSEVRLDKYNPNNPMQETLNEVYLIA